jgi:DNA-binding NtrC family response regulator
MIARDEKRTFDNAKSKGIDRIELINAGALFLDETANYS